MQTIIEARKFLRTNFKVGTGCPCCGQFVKEYKRSISGAMAYALILIWRMNRKNQRNFFHVEKHFKEIKGLSASVRGDFAKLKHWGLIEKLDHDDVDGSRAGGYYRITPEGISFIKNEITVPKYALMYNNDCNGFEGDDINIHSALKNKFNYQKLMRGE